MANGKPDDHPVTDTVVYGRHPFPRELEALVVAVHARDPGVFVDLEWAPFDWARGTHVAEAMRLLTGLVQHHGDPLARSRLLAEYRAATPSPPATRPEE